MSLWRKFAREATGVVRSVCYDLGLLSPRQGRRTRRLMLVTAVLATVAMAGLGWLGAVIATQQGLNGLDQHRPATVDGPDLQVPATSDQTVLSQIERSPSPSHVPSSAPGRRTGQETSRTPSPSPTPSRSERVADRPSPPPPPPSSPPPSSEEPEPPPESASPSYRRK